MTHPTVLVLGAGGRLGAAAVQGFAAAGWHVLAQMRRAPAAPLPAGASHLAIGLEDTAALVAAAAGARSVVYGVNPPYTEWDSRLLPLARQGMEVAARLGACFMLPGNVYNFGAGMPARLHPDTPQLPTTTKGRQRVALEAEIAARAAGGALRGVVIRAGDFYGSGGGSWFDQAIVKGLRRGRLVYPGPLDVAHAWAYLPDLAQAFVRVAERELGHDPRRHGAASGEASVQRHRASQAGPDVPSFQTLHFAGHTLTGAELLAHIEAAAASLGWRPSGGWRRAGMPWRLIRAVGTVRPLWRELARMSYLWRVPHTLDASALQQVTGELPGTPPASAIRDTLVALGFAVRPRSAPAGPERA